MFYVRFTVNGVSCITSVTDITFLPTSKRIEFTPTLDVLESFYINNCTAYDFDTLSGAFRSSKLVNLDALGYKVLFD